VRNKVFPNQDMDGDAKPDIVYTAFLQNRVQVC
jgi:hypothetical protein